MNRSAPLVVATLLAIVLVTAAAAAAQETSLEIGDVSTRSHPEVSMTVTAPQELVGTALSSEAFQVLEDGDPAALEVAALPNDDLAVLLLVDTSGSMRGEAMAAAKSAAIGFIHAMPAPVSISVMEFGWDPVLISPLTADRQQVVAAVDSLDAAGETALYDAIQAALRGLPADPGLRRAIVLLSDGGDTVSSASLEGTLNLVAASGTALHVVELETSESDPEVLASLASAGSGQLVSTDDPSGLAHLYQLIAAKLVNRYRLTYESSAHGLTEITVSLEHSEVRAYATRQIQLPAPPPEPPRELSAPVEVTPQLTFRPGSILSIGWVGEAWVPYAGAAAMFVAISSLILVLLAPRGLAARLASPTESGRQVRFGGVIFFTERVVAAAEQGLRRGGRDKALAVRLEQAGINLRAAEFTLLAAAIGIVVFALAFLLTNLFVSMAASILTGFSVRAYVSYRAQKRRAAFAQQLANTLQLLAGSLRTGYGLLQAIDTVAQEADSPTSEEFRRLIVETRIGRDFNGSLEAMSQRMGLEDFEWVVQAMEIHREVGGDLAEILDNIAQTVRERDQIRRQVKALSADGRLSGIILVALPFVVAAVIHIIQPTYLPEFTTAPAGWVMLAVGGALMAIGAVWIRRLVRLVF